MRPIKLELAAFEPYVNKIELNFEEHLKDKKMFLIHGETGAGKTSILDAICYALYDDSCGGERSKSMLRSEQASSSVETFVNFTFALGQKKYRVMRKPKQIIARKKGEGTREQESTAELYEIDFNGNEKLIEQKTSYVTNKIEELIGFESDQFRQVVFLPQGRFQKFLTANSEEREKILKILFKTDFYEKLENELYERSRAKENELKNFSLRYNNILTDANVGNSDELLKLIDDKTDELKKLTQEESTLKKSRDEANKILNEGRQLDLKFTDLERKISEIKIAEIELSKTSKEFQTAHEEYELRKSEEAQRLKLETDINLLQKVQKNFKNLESTKQKLSEAAEKSKQADEQFKAAEKLVNDCEYWLERLKREKENYIQEAAKFDTAQKKLRECKIRDELLEKISQFKRILIIAEKNFKNVNSKYMNQQKKVDELNEKWRKGSAAHLAANLSEGDPCPV